MNKVIDTKMEFPPMNKVDNDTDIFYSWLAHQVDPDSLYGPNSLTFIYVPDSNNLYVGKYPETHKDILQDNPKIFDDVFFGYTRKAISDELKQFGWRRTALEYSRAILGRISPTTKTVGVKRAARQNVIVIALWEGENDAFNKQNVKKLINQINEKYPIFANLEEYLVGFNARPILVSDFLNDKQSSVNPSRIIAQDTRMSNDEVTKKFSIGGKMYSLADLRTLRSDLHVRNDQAAKIILCHPDIDRYPELVGYKAPKCDQNPTGFRKTHPQNWRQAARTVGMPYIYSNESTSFKNWLYNQEK
jgi:hypothetical protein